MIKTEELYDLKWTLAEFIFPRLVEYRKIFINHNSPTVPIVDLEDIPKDMLNKELTPNERDEIWATILDEMIFAFGLYGGIPQHDYEKLDDDEIRKRVKRGLMLFSKYYEVLGI